jgi:hypothetical protein
MQSRPIYALGAHMGIREPIENSRSAIPVEMTREIGCAQTPVI